MSPLGASKVFLTLAEVLTAATPVPTTMGNLPRTSRVDKGCANWSASMHTDEMIADRPELQGISEPLIACIEDCFATARACTSCADACLAEEGADALRQCIRLDLDCANVCVMTSTLASTQTGSNPQVLRGAITLCALACRLCAEECEKHAPEHAHCRTCAEQCRSCEQACVGALGTVH